MTWLSVTLCAHCSLQTSYNNAAGYHSSLLVFNKHLPIHGGPLVPLKIITAGSEESIRSLSRRERQTEMEENVEISFSAAMQ